MNDNLTKKKLRIGIAFIVVGFGLWSVFPILTGPVRLYYYNTYNISGFVGQNFTILYAILALLGLILIIKGIVTIVKRKRLSDKEELESRIQNLEEKLDEKNESEKS